MNLLNIVKFNTKKALFVICIIFYLQASSAIVPLYISETTEASPKLIFATTQRGGGDTAAGTAPVTLGTLHAAIDTSVNGQNPPYNEIIGHATIAANHFLTADVFSEGISIASTGLLTTDDVSGPIIFDSYGSLSPTVSDGSLVQPADLEIF